MNLYIKNLADDCTDDKLREEFSPFGTITSAKVGMDVCSRRAGVQCAHVHESEWLNGAQEGLLGCSVQKWCGVAVTCDVVVLIFQHPDEASGQPRHK